jgi:hypothetical protein
MMTRWRGFQKGPIIIGGCPRSGTSLLLSVLSAHPDIYCIPDEAWAFYDTNTLAEFEGYVDRYLWGHLPEGLEAGYTRWCEKTPMNVLAFRNILDYFGSGCRLIHIVRDGRDVITSRHPQDPSRFWVEGWMWTWYVTEGARFAEHPQVHTVRYEDLVRRYEWTVSGLFAFLDEDVGYVLADWHRKAVIQEHSAWFDGLRPMDDGSIGRWKLLDGDEILTRFLSNPGVPELLARFGYA